MPRKQTPAQAKKAALESDYAALYAVAGLTDALADALKSALGETQEKANKRLTDLQSKRVPDFVKLAEAYGAVGLACDNPDDVDATIRKAMEINDVPVVVDFRVHRDAMVWPMVAAGTSNDDIKYARDMAPDFDEDDL